MIPQSRTLLVGLDAACWEYLDPLLQAGRLPNLAQLIEQGEHGSLRSTMPPITPAAWSSLVTGVHPGKHGVFEWVRRQPLSYRFTPVASNHRVGTTVWARLNAAGVRVGVVNVPLTYPVQPLDGFLLCGFSTPTSACDLTYPSELLSEIEAEFGRYQPIVQIGPSDSAPQASYDAERDHQKQIVKIAAALAQTHSVQVLILNLMLLDHSNHTMPTMDLVEQAMVDTDADLGWLLAEFAPDNVLAISDHGSRRVKGVFLLGAWLADYGFLAREVRPASERTKVINYILRQWPSGSTSLLARFGRRLLCEGLNHLPAPLTSPLWHTIEREVPLALMQVETLDGFVPNRTQVYPVGANRGSLRLNAVGREPEGIVSKEDREMILAQLIEALGAIRDPDTGELLFSGLYQTEDLYTGPFTREAPDLIGDYYQSDWSVVSGLVGLRRRPWRYFSPADRWHGDHSRDGIYVFAGRDFHHHPERGNADLLDIPATLLYLYDVPLPDDYDGQPLSHTLITTDRSLRYQPGDERHQEESDLSYTEGEEQQVLRRLSQLGYVD
jgi:predicted AlkP superfamily phosphohydrolase/phosphomutase